MTGLDRAIVVTLAAGAGLAPAWHGYYALSVWGPIALALLVGVVAVGMGLRSAPHVPAVVALAGLVALWGWSTLSIGWAESADQAMVGADRWLLYAAFFALLVATVRDRRMARLAVAVAAAAVVTFGGYLTVRLMLPGAADLFLGGRLSYPIGYVNGQAGYLLLALWPSIAVAERARRPWVAGLALGVAVVLAGLVLLAQARAIVPALAISAAILVALVPGRRRRCWALLGLVAGVALAAGPLLDVYGATRPGARGVDEDGLRAAVLGLLGAAALVGALWGLARSVAARPTPGFARRLRAGSAASLAAVSILALAGALLGVGEPVGATADAWHEFKQLDVGAAQSSSSRFSSGGGNRYDYWRIAVEQFRDRPLEGIGAGNYDTTYFAERRTTEDVRQAHSLPLQTLGELGLVGLIALSLFVGGVLGGLVRLARDARTGQREATLAVSAGGTFLIWLLHTSVDWLHLIPGLTGIALCAAAALVAPRGVSDRPALTKGARTAIAVACCAVAALGALLVGSVVLAERDTAQARQLVVGDPRGALEEVDSALAIDDEAVEAYYVGAAAYARLDRYRAARASLLEAAAREPSDFVTWALIGDLALRRGDRAAAQSAYARASRLNPRDEALRRLARDPAAALPAAD